MDDDDYSYYYLDLYMQLMLRFLVDQDYVKQQDDAKVEKNLFRHILDKVFHVDDLRVEE
jgi:hypothetical protein